MLGFRDDYTETIREIHKAANNFRKEERPDWKTIQPWHVCFDILSDKWWVNFFDADGHLHKAVFEIPPYANDNWFRAEIASQLRDN